MIRSTTTTSTTQTVRDAAFASGYKIHRSLFKFFRNRHDFFVKKMCFSSGNVGIGTVSPTSLLHVIGDVQVGAKANPRLNLSNNSGTASTLSLGADSGSGFIGTITNGPLQLYTNNTEKVRIDASGNVGIGTANPSNPLDVNGLIGTTSGLRIGGNSVMNRAGSKLQVGDVASNGLTVSLFSGNVERLSIDGSGNIGIGTTAPADKLQVLGDIRVGTSGVNGCLKDFSGGTIVGTCSSDARLKRNFRLLGPVSDKLLKISPKFYQWRSEEFPEKHFGDQEELGLVAQDLLEVIPELVQIDDDGLYRVRYQQIPFYLIKGFAEQQEAIKSIDDKYSREIASLKIENAQIKQESVKMRSDYTQIKAQSESLQMQNRRLQQRLDAIEKKLNLK